MFLEGKTTLILRFIEITLNSPLIKSGGGLIYAYFQESKHQNFGSFYESKHQDFGNLNEAILWEIKRIVLHEGLYISSHTNDKGCCFSVMV